jgi:Gpi18-like mannosyltransferase
MSGWIKQHIPYLVCGALLGLSLYLRIISLPWISADMTWYLVPWYNRFQNRGILFMLGKPFSNYTPPYLYLIALATLTSGFITKVTAIKLISIIFDAVSAWIVHMIVRLKYRRGVLPYLAGALYFAAPTILANSSIWGQADSIYTTFLLACVHFILQKKPLAAAVSFALSFSFKQQAVFLLPFLLLLTLRKQIPWYYFFLVPIVYVVLAAPTVYLGRSWGEVLTIYFSQASNGGPVLSRNAANLYVFLPTSANEALFVPSLIAGFGIICIWVMITWRFTKELSQKAIILFALLSVALVPFVLPKMHDRYFYPADALSIVLAFWVPELWFIPVAFQLASGASYSLFLLNEPFGFLAVGAIINSFTMLYLLRTQFTLQKGNGPQGLSETAHES